MIQPEFAAFVIPGLFLIIVLSLAMQFLRSRDLKSSGLSRYTGVTNLLLMLVMLILFLVFAMVIVSRYLL